MVLLSVGQVITADQILTQHQIKERITMAKIVEVEQLETGQLETQAMGRVQCDQCSARAAFEVDLPFGALSFCYHHYNKNVEALTNQGGVARILNIYEKEMRSV
jgi:hypothetical protein